MFTATPMIVSPMEWEMQGNDDLSLLINCL